MQTYGKTKMSKITAGKRKLPEGRRQKITLTIDPAVWSEFQKMAGSMGLSAARLVEITLKASVASRTQSIADVMGGIFKDMVSADKTLSIKEKMRMQDLIEEE